jgi:S-adenosylhomocysteine hydrolase
MKQEIPQIGTKEFNELASACFGGKPKQQTGVEFLVEMFDLKTDLAIIDQAKEMEKQQQGYGEEEVLEILYKHTEDLLAGKKVTLEEWFKQFKNK